MGPLELEALRDAIQRVCQATNPLGKSMEYVREDMDDMRLELAQWREEHRRRAEAMVSALRETEESLEPYLGRLREAEERCRDMEAKIVEVKARIVKNDQRIVELLKLVVQK